jgi:hypothetical protein
LESKRNGSPFGLQVITFGPDPRDAEKSRSGIRDNDFTSWEGGSMTWTALGLYLGRDVPESLAMAQKAIGKWTDKLRDPWDVRDLYTIRNNSPSIPDGYPWCNSHYGRHLIFWAIPLALSGQQYSAAEKRLVFTPATGTPSRLPWFTPQANGVLESLGQGKHRLTVLSGKLALKELRVAGSAPCQDVEMVPGKTLDMIAKERETH